MRLRRAKIEALRRGTPVKWPGCGHEGWWRVERVDSQFVRIERDNPRFDRGRFLAACGLS